MISMIRRLLSRPPQTPETQVEPLSPGARSIVELLKIEEVGSDLLWAGPTSVCPCGNHVFKALVWFGDDREISGYFTEMVCAFCGSVVRGVTPVDADVMDR